ncbi:MAG: hypothetical protein ACI8XO_001797 [Verrucomicrobiales bacterium]|jgi:hypothetical protein
MIAKNITTILILATAFTFAGDEKPSTHPDTKRDGWNPLFDKELSNANYPEGVWTRDEDGVLTASKDEALWSEKKYHDFVLDLEFKTDKDTNSGIIVHCSDTKNWIPNSVEIQIADDHGKWKDADRTWRCAAIFGRLAAKDAKVKKPGEWNRYTVTCKGKMIYVVLNGELVTEMDMAKWTDPKKNPDGTDIPSWLSKAAATLPLEGYIGFQGKHAGAPIYFRNIRIKELKAEGKAE